MEDTISVIVPVYNVEKYLDKCISSIVNQTYKNLEIILINDGSTDNSLQICEKWKEKDDRIILINKENTGVSDTRNRGLDIATGKYVSFIDSDDFLELNMMEQLINEIKKGNIELVICGYNYLYENRIKVELFDCLESFDKYGYLKEAFKMDASVWNKLFVRNIIGSLRFKEDLKVYEDMLFLYEYLDKIQNVSIIRKILYNYNKSNLNSTLNVFSPKKNITAIKAFYDINKILEKYNIQERYNRQANQVCNLVLYKKELGKNFDYTEYDKIIKEYMDKKLLFKVKGLKNKVKVFFAYYFADIYIKYKMKKK